MGQAFSKGRLVWRSWKFSPLNDSRKRNSIFIAKWRNTYRQSTKTTNCTVEPIPTELLLHVFSFLELKPYIMCHGVCREWRQLLPLSDIHPIRRRMFNLFHRMLSNPNFLKTREWTIKNLKHFDRQAYIDSLLSQYPDIPDEFRFWILEWPARMAINCMWPALPFVNIDHSMPDKNSGVNWLAYNFNSPSLLAMIYKHGTPDAKYIPALLIFKDYRSTWLVFDRDEPDLFGRVFVNNRQLWERSGILPRTWSSSEPNLLRYSNDINSEDDGSEFQLYVNKPFIDWISYQEYEWSTWINWVSLSFRRYPSKHKQSVKVSLLKVPPKFAFCSTMPGELPSPPWQRCHERQYQELLVE